ncbi:MAG: glycosyltransferase family 2 protein [Planctomycetes bacterium]|jgi:GT2 family glycosyltransferase|nr:glycosyltransferase family 2 protein [Planctomycetota bacterium]
MSCSVVIPCWNGAELTRACVHSLLQQTTPPDEILLVDNASRDATPQLGAMHPSVRVLRQPHNRGFAGGVNAGVQAATGAWLLILNNDTRAAPNLLHELRTVHAMDAAIGAVAPVSNEVMGQGRLELGDRGRDEATRAAIAASLQHEPSLQDVTTLSGLCLLLRRTTIDEVGLFDERFGAGNFEDNDFCLRLRLRGFRLVLARRAFLHHEGHATFRAMGLPIERELEARRAAFAAKWRGQAAGRATLAALDGNVMAAAAAANEALAQWPHWPDAHWYLAQAAARRGDPERAIACFHSLLRQCPQHTDGLIGLALALLAADREASAPLDALARQPLSALQRRHLCEQLGKEDYRRGRIESARDHFAVALQLGTDPNGELHNWLGLCQLAGGAIAEARASFAAAAAAGHALANTNLGICLHRDGALPAARRHFARACELAPDDPVARANYARSLAPT